MFVTNVEFRQVYWKYYLILERDVLNVEPYVTFHPDNYYCFSNEFIKLYQAICSEIDVICQKYCKYIKDTTSIMGKYQDIRDYAEYILTQHPEIVEQKVYLIEQNDCKLVPWAEWHFDPSDHRNSNNPVNVTPEWWKEYNDLKHRRSDKNGNSNVILLFSSEEVLLSTSIFIILQL